LRYLFLILRRLFS